MVEMLLEHVVSPFLNCYQQIDANKTKLLAKSKETMENFKPTGTYFFRIKSYDQIKIQEHLPSCCLLQGMLLSCSRPGQYL